MFRTIAILALATGLGCGGSVTRNHQTTYATGQPRWQVQLVDGVPHGPSITYYDNGRIASRGSYSRGRRHGEFVYYTDGGAVVRIERWRDGALVGETRGEAAAIAHRRSPPASVTPATLEPWPDDYAEIRLHWGLGYNGTTRERSGDDDTDIAGSAGITVLKRHGRHVFGGTLTGMSDIFGAGHGYFGALYGVAGPGKRVHAEVLAELGLHVISGLGNDLFSTGYGDTDAQLPYAGVRARLIGDVFSPRGLVLELAVQARHDLARQTNEVMQTTCLFGCTNERQTWELGGTAAEVVFGVAYQF